MAPRTTALLTWCLAIRASVAQYDPVHDFCRRWGQQTAVVDRKLYIDGGLVNYKPFSQTSQQNLSNTFLAYNDLDTPNGMPNLYANLSKNASIPDVNGGILWEDTVNKRLYLYGGEYFGSTPTSFELYSYDILYNQWQAIPPTGPGTINARSYGAGVSISSRGEAYYYGGWMNNASASGWTGPPVATSHMIKYDMDANSWSNVTGPDSTRRAEGVMVFIPVGDAGMLVYFGGSQDLYGNGTFTPQSLDTIFMYDVANAKWYTQKTSGRTPEIRRRFCGGATWAQDQSSYNIYIYGGAGFPPSTAGYDDIYILTIPSFQWIRGPYPVGSNVTGAYPKSMMSCNVIDNSQMIVIGGIRSNDTTYSCDADDVQGTHNMNLGEQNDNNAIWAVYQANLSTYAVPTDVLTAVGGRNTGGATKTAPTTGFDAADLSVLMTRKATTATRTATRNVNTSNPPTNPPAPPVPPPPVLGIGAIVGIAVGGAVVVIAVMWGLCCVLVRARRRRRAREGGSRLDSVAAPTMMQEKGPPGPPPPPPAGPQQHPDGWGPGMGGSTSEVSSPTLTAVSQSRPFSGPGPTCALPPLPAELGAAADNTASYYPKHLSDNPYSPAGSKYGSFAFAHEESAELPGARTPAPPDALEAPYEPPPPPAPTTLASASPSPVHFAGPVQANFSAAPVQANFNPRQDAGWENWSPHD